MDRDRTVWPEGKGAAISFSFDDARESQLDTGMPLLDDCGAAATFYVSLGPLERRHDEWRKAAVRGHEIGNHTVNHPCSGNFAWSRARPLEEYTIEKMEAELDGASSRIEQLVGVSPQTFAYPCGQKFVGRGENTASYVPLVSRRFLAGRGFRDEACNDPWFCDLAQVAGVDGDGLTFDQYREWVTRAIQTAGWLVFACHDVGVRGSQTVVAAELKQLLRYLNEDRAVWIDTVAAVSQHILAVREHSQGKA